MSYKITKTYTKDFEITNICTNFMKYSSFSKVRQDRPKCELCEKKFEQEDNTNLALVVGNRPHLICDSCANEAIQGGVAETRKEER